MNLLIRYNGDLLCEYNINFIAINLEWLFVSIAPIILIAPIAGIVLNRKKV